MSYRILVIGLGQIGFSNAKYMTELGLDVDGFDISKQAVTKALEAKVIKKAATNFKNYDYYIVCVSTHDPHNQNIPSLSALNQVMIKLESEGKSNSLIGLDSTVPYGTTEMLRKLVEHRLHIVHVPHRYYSKEETDHGVNQMRVIGADSQCCMQSGRHFYGNILNIALYPLMSTKLAELTKIAENTYRFVQIAFAEELKMVCDKVGIKFFDLREAMNTKWNIEILEARDGINGHCLSKDSQMFIELCEKYIGADIALAAKNVNSFYRSELKLPQIGG